MYLRYTDVPVPDLRTGLVWGAGPQVSADRHVSACADGSPFSGTPEVQVGGAGPQVSYVLDPPAHVARRARRSSPHPLRRWCWGRPGYRVPVMWLKRWAGRLRRRWGYCWDTCALRTSNPVDEAWHEPTVRAWRRDRLGRPTDYSGGNPRRGRGRPRVGNRLGDRGKKSPRLTLRRRLFEPRRQMRIGVRPWRRKVSGVVTSRPAKSTTPA
jgi:hypothetical protein